MKRVQFYSLSLDVTVQSSEKTEYVKSVQLFSLAQDVTVERSEKTL